MWLLNPSAPFLPGHSMCPIGLQLIATVSALWVLVSGTGWHKGHLARGNGPRYPHQGSPINSQHCLLDLDYKKTL